MPTIVQRVSNAVAQGTRWRATPNARAEKDQTIKISSQKKAETQAGGWITFSALHWITFRALQTYGSCACFSRRMRRSMILGNRPEIVGRRLRRLASGDHI